MPNATYQASNTIDPIYYHACNRVTLTAQWVSVPDPTYTVTYRPGSHGDFDEVVHSGLALGATTPNPPFTPSNSARWDFDGWSPRLSATVTGDAIYTAQWAYDAPGGGERPTEDETEDETDPSSRPTDPSSGPTDPTEGPTERPTGSTGSTEGPTGGDDEGGGIITPRREDDAPPPLPPPIVGGLKEAVPPPAPPPVPRGILDGIFGDDIPVLDIFDNEIPLFAPLGTAAWALVNLLLSAVGVLFAIGGPVRAILRKRKEQKELKEGKQPPAEEPGEKRVRLICLIAAAVLGVAGVIVFLLTEDMSDPMVLLDNWTPLHIILLALGITAVVLAFKVFRRVVRFEAGPDVGGDFRRKVRPGEAVKKPETPSREGYLFEGWFTGEDYGIRWDFDNKVERSFTLYAKWDKLASGRAKEEAGTRMEAASTGER